MVSAMSNDPDYDDKIRFAEGLLKAGSEYGAAVKVAIQVFGDGSPRVGMASHYWPSDPIVLAHMQTALATQPDGAYLPTREELALKIHRKAEACDEAKDAVVLWKLFADIMGYIQRPETNIGNVQVNNNIVESRVLVVKDYGSIDNYMEKAAAQQAKLVEDVNASKRRN